MDSKVRTAKLNEAIDALRDAGFSSGELNRIVGTVTKTNAAKTNDDGFPPMPDRSDIDAMTKWWFEVFNWLSVRNGALAFAKPYLSGLYAQFMDADIPSKMNPYSGGYLMEPAHDGGSGYAPLGSTAERMQKTQSLPSTVPEGKVMTFNKRTGAMELIDLK